MKKHFKVISLIAILALVISIGMVGCTTRKPAKPNTPYSNQLNRNINYTGDRTDMNRNLNNNLNNRDLTNNNNINNRNVPTSDQATRIANRVTEIKEVKKATVAISGNTCLVGVNTTDNIKGKMTTALKNKIDKAVKESDPNIKHVHVTANPDLYKRIENVGRDIRTGKPLTGLATEIQEIIRRITPTTK